jgi:drug/metabolite transporter (DMT)-like permease
VVATTWQLTIIASLFVLMLFGRKFPRRIWAYSAIVFAGVLLVNLSRVGTENIVTLLLGSSPVLLAAFLYPLGNQLVWEAKHGRRGLPRVDVDLLDNAFAKVFLLSLGSLPFWMLLYPFTSASTPAASQVVSVALVALFSGVIATSLFLGARNSANDASQLAAVDATQSSEVLFALCGEILFLQASLPSPMQLFGILIAGAGLVAFVRLEDG